MTVDIGRGAAWVIEGCVTDAGGRCTRTRAVELTAAERQEYVRLWAEIRAIPRCEMDAIWPGDRNWVLTSSQGRWSAACPPTAPQSPSAPADHAAPTRAWRSGSRSASPRDERIEPSDARGEVRSSRTRSMETGGPLVELGVGKP
ncbi:MAG: hypothetical protein M5U28_24650 [Sandaracinaceae bacterium]|nr:hypothetical protein [Sandaracinaceae bacterium]